tara:strand:+ start:522 stop:773 length:252 start_codon:yes stop_codon:yes gene_type:complete
MAQWMKSFRSCNTLITSVGWSSSDQPSIPAPKKRASTSKVRKLVEKLTPQKEPSSDKKEKADSVKPEANNAKSTTSRSRIRRK